MEQDCGTIKMADWTYHPSDPQSRPGQPAAYQRVYFGIMEDIEERRMVPGQRLVETELAARFGVGRNAVREAMQQLAGRGVVELSPNRSPEIRRLDLAATMEVLEVAEALTGLACRTAARNFAAKLHGERLEQVIVVLSNACRDERPGAFSRARRHFYRTLLEVGGNRELQRLFPAVGMHIIYSQYQSAQLQNIRLSDYLTICDKIIARDCHGASTSGEAHVRTVREIILKLERMSSPHSA